MLLERRHIGTAPGRLSFPQPVRAAVSAPRRPTITNRARLLPIAFFMSYLLFTVFVFSCGPWPFPIEEGWWLYLFLACSHTALLLGYLSGAFKQPIDYVGRLKPQNLVLWSAVLGLILLLPTSAHRTGSWIPDVLGGITNPGEMYTQSLLIREESGSLAEYLRLVLGPVLCAGLPLGMFYWRRVGPIARALLLLSIFGTVALFIGMGTNKAIADTIIVGAWSVLAGYLAGELRYRFRHKALIATVTAVAFGLFISFFSMGQATRSGSGAVSGYFYSLSMHADYDNFMLQAAPEEWHVGILGLASYLSQGYYGLYLSMQEPFSPMFGVGHSPFLTRQIERLVGDPEFHARSYPGRIAERGWDDTQWSSIYPWLASDVTFPGTLVLLFIIGRLLACSWIDTLGGRNPFAVVMFSQFVIMLFYFPANSQCFHAGESVTGFWVALWFWLRTRHKVSR